VSRPSRTSAEQGRKVKAAQDKWSESVHVSVNVSMSIRAWT
jgi:hypothetical protein